jgi:hypothetical protein
MQESTNSSGTNLKVDDCLKFLNKSEEVLKDNDLPRVRGDSAVNIIPFQRLSGCSTSDDVDKNADDDGDEEVTPPLLKRISSSSSSSSSLNGVSISNSNGVTMKSLSRNTLRKLKRIGQEED